MHTHKQAIEKALRLSERDKEPIYIYRQGRKFYAWAQLSIDMGDAKGMTFTGEVINHADIEVDEF